MKMEGIKLGIPSERLICFPRRTPKGEEYQIPFKCKAVLDFSEFNKVCPEPQPRNILKPGDKVALPDYEDPEYIKKQFEHSTRKMEFTIIKSLEATEGLTWDQVKLHDPETWELWKIEMESAGFTEMEISRLHLETMRVNALDEATLEEARESFLQKQAADEKEKKG